MAAMRAYAAFFALFNAENMGVMIGGGYISNVPWHQARWERQAMMISKNVVSALRRDVSFVWHAIIAVVFLGFAGLAVAAALLDLLSLRN
jgi:hypothetical protein